MAGCPARRAGARGGRTGHGCDRSRHTAGRGGRAGAHGGTGRLAEHPGRGGARRRDHGRRHPAHRCGGSAQGLSAPDLRRAGGAGTAPARAARRRRRRTVRPRHRSAAEREPDRGLRGRLAAMGRRERVRRGTAPMAGGGARRALLACRRPRAWSRHHGVPRARRERFHRHRGQHFRLGLEAPRASRRQPRRRSRLVRGFPLRRRGLHRCRRNDHPVRDGAVGGAVHADGDERRGSGGRSGA